MWWCSCRRIDPFDHYFGTMAGVRGFEDPDALKLADGRSVFYQPDAGNPNGYLLPFHLDTHASSAQKIPSTSHAWAVQHEAWNGGRMDRWLPAHRKADGVKGPYVMGYYKRARHSIPVRAGGSVYHLRLLPLFRLRSPTWPNRMCLMTRHYRSGWVERRADPQQQSARGRIYLDPLIRNDCSKPE